MMNLYTVTYKRFEASRRCSVVASTIERAVDTAKRYLKKCNYNVTSEVVAVEKQHAVEAVGK